MYIINRNHHEQFSRMSNTHDLYRLVTYSLSNVFTTRYEREYIRHTLGISLETLFQSRFVQVLFTHCFEIYNAFPCNTASSKNGGSWENTRVALGNISTECDRTGPGLILRHDGGPKHNHKIILLLKFKSRPIPPSKIEHGNNGGTCKQTAAVIRAFITSPQSVGTVLDFRTEITPRDETVWSGVANDPRLPHGAEQLHVQQPVNQRCYLPCSGRAQRRDAVDTGSQVHPRYQ